MTEGWRGEIVNAVVRAGFFVVALLCVASTSWTTIGSDEVGLLSRIYFGSHPTRSLLAQAHRALTHLQLPAPR